MLAVDPGPRQVADDFGAFVAVRRDASFVEDGPLHGAWVAVKDNICVAGMPYTAGQPLFAQRLAGTDATAVSRLRAGGARVVGVTRTDAGGFGVTTPGVRNPLDIGAIVGGSSGGSAAAVAGGLADIGLGTDTGGSVRIPAACCGLHAFKPSFGQVPLDGVWPMAPSLDHVGLMTRGLQPLRAAAAALLQTPLQASGRAPRYGVDMRRLEGIDPLVAAAFIDMVARLRSCGAVVEEVVLPERRTVRDAHAVKVLGEARGVYAKFWPLPDTALGEAARQALRIAQGIDAAALARADAATRKVRSDLAEVLGRVDAVLTPTLPVRTPAVGARRVALDGDQVPLVVALTAETAIGNLTGCPALVLPLSAAAGPAHAGSVQVLAAFGKDAELFKYGFHLEAMFEGAPRLARAPATS